MYQGLHTGRWFRTGIVANTLQDLFFIYFNDYLVANSRYIYFFLRSRLIFLTLFINTKFPSTYAWLDVLYVIGNELGLGVSTWFTGKASKAIHNADNRGLWM